MRLDIFLTENGFVPSREKAKTVILNGQVYINGRQCRKPGKDSEFEKDKIEIRGEILKYVGRGGLKLEKALKEFSLDLTGKTAMDIGASTGGFTDCMLQNGAKKVYAVDVGKGQLSDKLKNDARVINMENTDIRHINIEETPSFISIDVSFISLTLVLPHAFQILSENGEAVALIKPQFEAGRGNVGKKGVVRDMKIHREVIVKILTAAEQIGFSPSGLSFSPIKGAEGNIEYLIYLKKTPCDVRISDADIDRVVNASHETDIT